MRNGQRLGPTFLLVALTGISLPAPSARAQTPLFTDNFESGLGRWRVLGENGVSVVASGDPAHGHVMALAPNGDVHALIRGSERWRSVRMEGEMLFTEKVDSYLGFMYAFQQSERRSDFGLIYLKGDGNYLQANPHHDYNVTRTFYPEYTARLSGPSHIEIGQWHRFRLEVVGGTAHVYVGDTDTPAMTFPLGAPSSGALGLQPRSVGGTVWVDNVMVTSINRFSYAGPPVPHVRYEPDSLLTSWRVAGPFTRTRDDLARRPDAFAREWRVMRTDARGAVPTAEVVDYHGDRAVAYFRVTVESRARRAAVLHVSSVEDLALWVNGRFTWFVPKTDAAWFDLATNQSHAGRRIPIELQAGRNSIVLRVRGGSYAGGGFFARVEGMPNDAQEHPSTYREAEDPSPDGSG